MRPHGTTSPEQLFRSHWQNVWNKWHQPNGGAIRRGALWEVCACVTQSGCVCVSVRARGTEWLWIKCSRADVVCVDFAEWMVIVYFKRTGGGEGCAPVQEWMSESSVSEDVCVWQGVMGEYVCVCVTTDRGFRVTVPCRFKYAPMWLLWEVEVEHRKNPRCLLPSRRFCRWVLTLFVRRVKTLKTSSDSELLTYC